MTARQVYEAVLVEMNKVQAPSLLLEDFNYLFNKAINQYINKRYNIYDINQQTTDDLRVLKSSVTLRALNTKSPVTDVTIKDSMYGAIYEFSLPQDYLHLLNCICNYRVNKPFKCYNANTYVQFPAQRLTSDMWSQIINNFYMRPSYKRPYYFIHNVNTFIKDPTSGWYGGRTPAEKNDPHVQNYGEKAVFNGNFGRVPSSKITLPTDPGNTDIQHLERTQIRSKYDDLYIDDNNHYSDANRKYGLRRYMDFNNWQHYTNPTDGNETIYIRTGNARVRARTTVTYYDKNRANYTNSYGADVIIAELSFDRRVDDFTYVERYSQGVIGSDGEPTDPQFFTFKTCKPIGLAEGEGNNANFELLRDELMKQGCKELKDIVITNRQFTLSALNYTYNEFGDRVENSGVNRETSSTTGLYLEYEYEPIGKVEQFDQVEKVGEVRYGNPSTVRLEIRYGKDNSLFTLDSVYVDYIKAPQFIRITQEQLDLTEDTSQIMEFPDYVIQEIINELVHIVMENASDPRLQSHVPISQSIANPAQQQEAPQSRRG